MTDAEAVQLLVVSRIDRENDLRWWVRIEPPLDYIIKQFTDAGFYLINHRLLSTLQPREQFLL